MLADAKQALERGKELLREEFGEGKRAQVGEGCRSGTSPGPARKSTFSCLSPVKLLNSPSAFGEKCQPL